MNDNNFDYSYTDAICCVLASARKIKTVHLVLNYYISNYERLNGDYTYPKNKPDYIFESEDEMVNYFIENGNEEQTFFWNKLNNNPKKIMVGAFFTSDNYLIMSLTFPADGKIEYEYLKELKGLLNSKIGIVSYNSLPDFSDGADFLNKYR